MGARRSGREAALQMLFAMEASGESAHHVTSTFFRSFEADPEGREYACEIVNGVEERREEIDKLLTKASDNWRLERMTRVDRNLGRLATWELLARSEIPRAVVFDEAIELAKSYSAEGGHAFVNGLLVKVADLCGRST